MGHLPTAEANGDLDFVSFLEKLLNRLAFEGQVVLVCGRSHTNFLEQSNLLVLARFALLLLLLKLETSIIEETAHRRDGRGGYFDEVAVVLLCEPKRFVEGKHPELLAVLADDPDFPGTDTLVDAEIFANRLSPHVISTCIQHPKQTPDATAAPARKYHRSDAQNALYHAARGSSTVLLAPC